MRKLWMAGFIAAALLGLSYARQRSGDPADLVLIDGDLKCVLTLLKDNIVYRDTQRLP